MEERNENEKKYERYGLKSCASILAENSYQLVKESFSPYTPPFIQTKIKSCKPNQSQGYKQLERCEYKTTYRPHIQLFKTSQECKPKKTSENSEQHQRKLLKTTKAVNKIFQHNSTDSESLKIYRDLYIYKSLGSVARKNLERAIAIYNANRDEIDLTRRFTSRRNSNSHRREQQNHKKVVKTETYLRTIKPKTDVKENVIKELKYPQRVICSQNKSLRLIDSETTVCKNIEKHSYEELHEAVKKQSLHNTEDSSNVSKNQIKKIVVRGDIKRILPKLPIRPIERKIKEKKQLAIAVLNISLPLVNEKKEGTQNNMKPKIQKTSSPNLIHDNYDSKNYVHFDGLEDMDEDLYYSSNRKRLVNDIKGKLFSLTNTKMSSKRRNYLLKLPITNMKGKELNRSSKNLSLLSFKEPDTTFTNSPVINNSLAMLPEHITKEQKPYGMVTNLPTIPNYQRASTKLWKIKKETDFVNQISMEKDKTIGTCELSTSFNISDQEYCYKTKIDYNKLRKILLHS